MKVLIIGASSKVGTGLAREFRRLNIFTHGTYNTTPVKGGSKLDVTDEESLRHLLLDYRPTHVFMCAAMTDVNKCQTSKTMSYLSNVTAIKSLVSMQKRLDFNIIHFSSPYVFDGKKPNSYTEEDVANPLNVYGMEKLESEELVLSCPNSLVIRTVGVFGNDQRRKDFVSQVADSLYGGVHVKVPADQMINPIHADDLAFYTVYLAQGGYHGIYNVAGTDIVTKYSFALQIAEYFHLDKSLVVPVDSHSSSIPRPLNGVLSTSKVSKVFKNYSASIMDGLVREVL